MATNLSSAQAADMIYRSMLTGVPTAEFDRAGGYDAVYSAAKAGGYDLSRPPAQTIAALGPTIAAQGYGNLSYAPGSTVNDPGLQEAGYSNYYEQAVDTSAMSSKAYQKLQQQLAEMQKQYDTLVAQQGKQGGLGSGGIAGGGVVDDGSTFNPGGTGGLGTGGVVYGPDGTSYSSAAAAIAAGVTNFTYTKPVIPQTPAGPGLIQGADNLTAVPPGVTGNVNPGGLIAGQNSQLFQRPTGVQLPAGVRNPFAI